MKYKVKLKESLHGCSSDRYVFVDADSPRDAALHAVNVELAEVEVELTLTPDEAWTLRSIFYAIGGDPGRSRRRHVHRMEDKLVSIMGSNRPITSDMNGNIYFNDPARGT